ncbi:putative prephenate dehydratase [Lyophyllum shimeji]|uniref:prephenate dehydratase n=1 Tax=Lyophyllum shimeji TaxID=47721 RepID=A0A9P3PIU6_LYOSH|nr:putative prephenate dehydratase [Lyophyllum shimeji]
MFKVAVLGPLGTYTHEAAHKLFGPGVEYYDRDTIEGVFQALPAIADAGVVPQENSIFGNVIETYDNLREAGFVRGEVTLEVMHCLLVRPGVKLQDIQKVLSHEQALGQCRGFLRTHLPSASLVKTSSTAAAARALLDNSSNCAAICSRVCASLFGLTILYEGIQDETANFTRFYLITSDNKVALPTWLPTIEPSRALIRILAEIHPSSTGPGISKFLAALQLDFIRIDRRPSPKSSLSQYVYFVELQGDPNTEAQRVDTWSSRVGRAVQRVEEAGGVVEIIGLWPHRQ